MGFFDTSRKRVRRCPACGTRVEFVVPALPYYLWASIVFVLGSVIPLLWFFLATNGHWEWGAAAALGTFALLAGANVYFNSILEARRVDEVPPEDIVYRRKLGG